MDHYHVRLQVMDVLKHLVTIVATILRRDTAFHFHVTKQGAFVLVASTAILQTRPPAGCDICEQSNENSSLIKNGRRTRLIIVIIITVSVFRSTKSDRSLAIL